MKRFYHESNLDWMKQFFSAIIFLAVLLMFTLGIRNTSEKNAQTQATNLELAVTRGIAHCYASEGRYPESLSYLLDNYDIYYDEDVFFIDYQVLGANIFPDVTIIQK